MIYDDYSSNMFMHFLHFRLAFTLPITRGHGDIASNKRIGFHVYNHGNLRLRSRMFQQKVKLVGAVR